jgi:glycine cleavage system H protein
MQPADLKYSETHEWVRIEEKIATIGITDHAQSELGDVVYVELPQVGASIKKGDIFGTIESVKTVSDLVAPVSGQVVTVNQGLLDTPEAVNDSPYASGWLITVSMEDASEVDRLMSAEQYETFIQEH